VYTYIVTLSNATLELSFNTLNLRISRQPRFTFAKPTLNTHYLRDLARSQFKSHVCTYRVK